MANSPKRTKLISDETLRAVHVCQLCNKGYERADHLQRHLDSHRNERTFRCSDCPRAFNRRDLLLRHQATHAKNAATGRVGPDRTNERAIKACDPCVVSKLKCDNTRPCQRCRKRQVECKTETLNRSSYVFTPVSSGEDASPRETAQSLLSPPATETNDKVQPHHDLSFSDVQAMANDESFNMTSGWEDPLMPFPSIFDQIMAPDFVASDNYVMPPDLFSILPDRDWQGDANDMQGDANDIFGLEFTPTIDNALGSQLTNFPFPMQPEDGHDQSNDMIRDEVADAGERHAIFLRSPWFWKPEANQNAFSEHNSLPLDERQIDIGTSPHQPYLPALVMQDTLSPQSRDRIFQLVVKTAKSQVTIPSFPSTKCLDILLRVGIAKRMETDAWIHPYTFDSEKTRPELLTALIAAGCVCFGIPSVSKTGLMLFEIVRVALNRLHEDDNSVIRDLQYLQACMLWIDVTAFSGFKRKMEIAESSLQPLVTALRRAGKFDRVAYSQIRPDPTDPAAEIDRKWKRWIEEESYRRLVHHLFEHDIQTTVAKVRNPLISYAELSLPLPSTRNLWLAPSPEAWQLSILDLSNDHSSLSVRDLLADCEVLRCLSPLVDEFVARTAYLYSLAAQTWEFEQQSIITTSKFAASADPSAQLWMQTRQQKLYQSLQTFHATSTKTLPATSRLFTSFIMMSMHVNPDLVIRFAGKCGEAEAHRAYQDLQPWSETKQARTAIWHAAQVLRFAREVPPYQLRGADTFIIYHAVMVLWSWAMMHRSNDTSSSTGDAPRVLLDGDDVDAFVLMGTGRPCLRCDSNGASADLKDPRAVMRTGINVLESNYPLEKRANLPQLTRSLCELMAELGGLKFE